MHGSSCHGESLANSAAQRRGDVAGRGAGGEHFQLAQARHAGGVAFLAFEGLHHDQVAQAAVLLGHGVGANETPAARARTLTRSPRRTSSGARTWLASSIASARMPCTASLPTTSSSEATACVGRAPAYGRSSTSVRADEVAALDRPHGERDHFQPLDLGVAPRTRGVAGAGETANRWRPVHGALPPLTTAAGRLADTAAITSSSASTLTFHRSWPVCSRR